MKNAREMFEQLGFKFEYKKEYAELMFGKKLIKDEYIYRCNASINYKYSWVDIRFDLINKKIIPFQNSMNGNCGINFIGIDLLEAINQQCKELGWLDEEI